MGNFVREVGTIACSTVEAATGSLFCVSSSDVTAVGIGLTGAFAILVYALLSSSLLRI